jgi:AcrR family transcriptional regulator
LLHWTLQFVILVQEVPDMESGNDRARGVGGGPGFAARTKERLRAEIVAAAAEEVLARGWDGLRMQAIADMVGISRQTIYNEFGGKPGLARALVAAMTHRYIDEVEGIIDQSRELGEALRATARRTLEIFADDALFKTILAADGSGTFLPLYTSEGAPLIDLITVRMSAIVTRRFPHLDPRRMRIATEAITRLMISYVVLPMSAPEQVAD